MNSIVRHIYSATYRLWVYTMYFLIYFVPPYACIRLASAFPVPKRKLNSYSARQATYNMPFHRYWRQHCRPVNLLYLHPARRLLCRSPFRLHPPEMMRPQVLSSPVSPLRWLCCWRRQRTDAVYLCLLSSLLLLHIPPVRRSPARSNMLFFRTWLRWPSRGGWAALTAMFVSASLQVRPLARWFSAWLLLSLAASQGMFEPYLKSFYIRSTDPTQIKILKVTPSNVLLYRYHPLGCFRQRRSMFWDEIERMDFLYNIKT